MDSIHNQQIKDSLEELIAVRAQPAILKHIVRSIYHHNSNSVSDKILFFSSLSIERIACIVMIQAHWRGHLTRQKYMPALRKQLIRQRAARVIQRWLRNLSYRHQQHFKFISIKNNILRHNKSDSLAIDMSVYMKVIEMQKAGLFPWHEWRLLVDRSTSTLSISLRSKKGKMKRQYLWGGHFLKRMFPEVSQ